MGWREVSMMRTHVFKLCGQFSGEPNEVFSQSNARISSPILPPPSRKAAFEFISWGMVVSSSCINSCRGLIEGYSLLVSELIGMETVKTDPLPFSLFTDKDPL